MYVASAQSGRIGNSRITSRRLPVLKPGFRPLCSRRRDSKSAQFAGKTRIFRERFVSRRGRWRRGWDSNPRYHCWHTGFRDRPDRPLWHLSGRVRIGIYISADLSKSGRNLTEAPRPRNPRILPEYLGDFRPLSRPVRYGWRRRPAPVQRHRAGSSPGTGPAGRSY